MPAHDEELLSRARSVLRETRAFLEARPGLQDDCLVWEGNEPKAAVDRELNQFILDRLEGTGVPILSEEMGQSSAWKADMRTWIVDPLDGTLNFVRKCGPSAISICLWDAGAPVFGAVLDMVSRDIFWGGRAFGAWRSNERIGVSVMDRLETAVICTGIPSSFDFNDRATISDWVKTLSLFGRVRMLGSAASSLMLIASGAADCYYEANVKIWDVAAGLAILEGAGGRYRLSVRDGAVVVAAAASNAVLSDALFGRVGTS